MGAAWERHDMCESAFRLLHPEGGRKLLRNVGNLRDIASPKKLHCQRHRYDSLKSHTSVSILCSLHNFTCEHAAVSRGTDRMPNPTAVVLLSQKIPAITAARLSYEILAARQQIDIGGSTVYVPFRGIIDSKFHHKIFCRK